MTRQFLTMFMAVAFLFSSCHKNDTAPESHNFVDATVNSTVSKLVIQQVVQSQVPSYQANYDVTLYSIGYKTTYMGQPVNSKGLLVVPNGVQNVRLLMYCHGTFQPNDPTKVCSSYKGELNTSINEMPMVLGWAAAGYTVFMPDYIGYGSTADKEHPYVCYAEMFKSNIDGLLASKEFIKQKNLSYDNRVFLAGLSEGAGASLSAHKFIQEQYASSFTVAASSNYAGPYNCTKFMQLIWANPSQPIIQQVNGLNTLQMPYASWTLYSINKFSGINRPTNQLYMYSVSKQLDALTTPSYVPNQVFNTNFMNGLATGSDVEFCKAIQQNSFDKNWKPVGKVFLHQGDADEVVPYFNAVDANAGLTAAGGTVKLYSYPGGKHCTDPDKYFANTLADFNAVK